MKKSIKYIIIGILLVGLLIAALFVALNRNDQDEKEDGNFTSENEQETADQLEEPVDYKPVYLTGHVKIVFPSEVKEISIYEECPEVGGVPSSQDPTVPKGCYCHPVIDFINSALTQLNIDSEISDNSVNRIDSFSSNQTKKWKVYVNDSLSPYPLDGHCIENDWSIEIRYE